MEPFAAPVASPKTPYPPLERFTPTVPLPDGLEEVPYTPADPPDVAELMPLTPG
jgi:hypothetical protein